MRKKLSKKLLEQMTISERFNYISALKQMEETISQAKDNVSENGSSSWIDEEDSEYDSFSRGEEHDNDSNYGDDSNEY
tara:strand:- start:1716 stop:1949 length:234 start_codon:yes stop_codon:yes gene_type:complete